MGSKVVRERHLTTCGSTQAAVASPPRWSQHAAYDTPVIRRVKVTEGDLLSIAPGSVATLLSATFTRFDRTQDVSVHLRTLLRRGGLSIRVTPAVIGAAEEAVAGAGRQLPRGVLTVTYTPTGRSSVLVTGTRNGEADGEYRPVGGAGGTTLYQREDGACLYSVRSGEWQGRWALSPNGSTPVLVSPFLHKGQPPECAALLELQLDKSRDSWGSSRLPQIWLPATDKEPDVVIGGSTDALTRLSWERGSQRSAPPSVGSSPTTVVAAEHPMIIGVGEGGAAAAAGVRIGMRLSKVDQTAVSTVRDAEQALRGAPDHFSVELEAHWIEPRADGLHRRRRVSVTSLHCPAEDEEWAQERIESRRALAQCQAEQTTRLAFSKQEGRSQQGSAAGDSPARLHKDARLQMDVVFPPRPSDAELRRLGICAPHPPNDEGERWMQMIRDGAAHSSVQWLYCSVDVREISKVKNAEERMQRANAKCRRALEKLFAPRGHRPLVREKHAQADPAKQPSTRREVRSLIRSSVRYGILMDILATRRYIWTGEPHQVASQMYDYLEEYYAVLVKFVLVGITDNASKRVARDMFCKDRLPPEQGGPGRYVTSTLNKSMDRGKFKQQAPPPMDAIDNEHQYVVFAHSDWERAEIVKLGEKWKRDKKQQRDDRYKTPKWESEKGGWRPPPAWLLELEARKEASYEEERQRALEYQRRLIWELRQSHAGVPDPEAGLPSFMRSTAASGLRRGPPDSPQQSPRHQLVAPHAVQRQLRTPSPRPGGVELPGSPSYLANCPRCWTHAVLPRPHGVLAATPPGSQFGARSPRSAGSHGGAASDGGARLSADEATDAQGPRQQSAHNVVEEAAGMLIDISSFVSPDVVQQPTPQAAGPPPVAVTGDRRRSIAGSPRSPRRRQSRKVTHADDPIFEGAAGQAAAALLKLEQADNRLRKLSRDYRQVLRERRHEQVLKERAEEARVPWHQQTLVRVAAGTVPGRAPTGQMPSPCRSVRSPQSGRDSRSPQK